MQRTTKRKSLEEQVAERQEPKELKAPKVFVPTGSTLLNLALSDRANGGYPLGRLVNIIGDSSAGKSFLTHAAFAEAAQIAYFDEYRFIRDDTEEADSFDVAKLFGKKVAARLEYAGKDAEGNPCSSNTTDDFLLNFKRAVRDGRPFIYVLDSLDALEAKEDQQKMDDIVDAMEKGKQTTGSYGMAKAKFMSGILRNIVQEIQKTRSLLIIVSQTRDNIDPMSPNKKTRSGGKALRFYSTQEIWLALAGKERKTSKGQSYVIGSECKAKVSKNRITGKLREVEFSILYDYGVDDLTSCIEWMIKNGFWKKSGQTITIPELGLSGTMGKVIDTIESEKLYRKISALVGRAWAEVEEGLKLGRKSKYED